MGKARLAPGLVPGALVAGVLLLGGQSAALALDGGPNPGPGGVMPQPVLWSGPASPVSPAPLLVEPGKSVELASLFERQGFLLSAVRDGSVTVPRVYVSRLPADLAKLRRAEERKELFLRTLLPLVLLCNEELRTRRGRLLALQERISAGDELEVQDRAWLAALAELYRTDPDELDTLLTRVDEIPVSLALAQAILESGWGTSRFARHGNALFGEKAWSSGAAHLIQRNGSNNRFRAFPDLMASVRAYMHNLNTNPAYRSFRRLRADQRAKGVAPAGRLLLPKLTGYAERPDYLPLLDRLIRSNRLDALETARLDSDWFAGRPLYF